MGTSDEINDQRALNPFYQHKPNWLRVKLPNGAKAFHLADSLKCRDLNTICASGLCPNRGECWGAGTATFMICGDICTRGCRFCNVKSGKPHPLDKSEIINIIKTISEFNLKHVVLTSVDRDDLPDGGASHWVEVIKKIRESCPHVTLETLIPDFGGNEDALSLVIEERPEVVSHNIETVRRLTPSVRSKATYEGSLKVLNQISNAGLRAKSGLMLGLGETIEEVIESMDDLQAVGCKVITIGQYLQPTEKHYPVKEYVHPDIFESLREIGLKKGFLYVESSPLVRSSYHAEKHVL